MGDLAPVLDSAGPSALTVDQGVGLRIFDMDTTRGRIEWMQYQQEQMQRTREEVIRRYEAERKAAADAAAADLALWQNDYAQWYANNTAVNGCSVPEVVQNNFPTGRWDEHADVCAPHDVAYGRGGILQRGIADAKLAWAIWEKGDRLKAVATYVGLRIGGWANYSWTNPDGSIRWGAAPTPEEHAAARQAEADAQAAAAAAHQATLARGNEIIGQVLIPASPTGQNTFQRQALADAGITDVAEQDQLLENYFNRDKTDMR